MGLKRVGMKILALKNREIGGSRNRGREIGGLTVVTGPSRFVARGKLLKRELRGVSPRAASTDACNRGIKQPFPKNSSVTVEC